MQKIPFETLQRLAFGVSYTKIADGLLYFSRFSENERNNVQPNEYYETKILSTAGVRLEFITDSRTLELETAAQTKSRQNRMFYAFDIVCDGKLIGQIKNFTEPPVYPYGDYPFDDQKGVFTLPAGNKRICIYFPFTVTGKIRSLSLDDGAAHRPVAKKTKLLQYGDSITQGYDAIFPSRTYASLTTDRLDADTVNKGIAGSLFWPELVQDKPDFRPNLITVAYGTNDWNAAGNFDDFKRRCNAFFARLAAHYPETRLPRFPLSGAPTARKAVRSARLIPLQKPSGKRLINMKISFLSTDLILYRTRQSISGTPFCIRRTWAFRSMQTL